VSDCPRCGAAGAGEEYCLTCGAHLRAPRPEPRIRAGAPGAVLAVVLLAALGALVAIAVSRGSSAKTTVVATNLPTRTTVRLAPVLGTVAVPVATTPAVTTSAPPTLPGATALTSWTLPDGYTVVLASVSNSSGRATAVEVAKHALARGLSEVGVIDSKDFSGLAPGFFVVFSGAYSSEAEASQHLAQAKGAGFAAAYARHVTR
jgi:hypothetical protein